MKKLFYEKGENEMQGKSMAEIEIVRQYIRMCDDGWRQGWHERNGGNCTYRLTEQEVKECQPYFNKQPGEWKKMEVQAENLGGEFFLATGSGKFFRNIILAPEENICLLEINEKGDSWRIVWGLVKGGVPTSEFPSHFMNHSVRKKATQGTNRVIYHAHPANLIAMTFVLPLSNRDFSRALWKSATECPVVFPHGVGVVEWMVPGGADIALASCKLMEEFDAVVWAHHGLFCAGPSLDVAFGLMHTIEKAAEIFIKVASCTSGMLQTITDENLKQVAKDFGVTINEEFLD